MNRIFLGVVLGQLALLSASAHSGAIVDDYVLSACGKKIAKEIGVPHYTTFDKQVGVVRQGGLSNQFFINATYRHPSSDKTQHFRAVCEGKGVNKVSVITVTEGAWVFSDNNSLTEQLADIGSY